MASSCPLPVKAPSKSGGNPLEVDCSLAWQSMRKRAWLFHPSWTPLFSFCSGPYNYVACSILFFMMATKILPPGEKRLVSTYFFKYKSYWKIISHSQPRSASSFLYNIIQGISNRKSKTSSPRVELSKTGNVVVQLLNHVQHSLRPHGL